MVVLSSIIDEYALFTSAYKSSDGGYIPSGLTYLLNLKTGESVATEMLCTVNNRPIAISGNYLYFFKGYIAEIRTDLYRCDITTGKCEPLIEELPDRPANNSGCIIGDYLYFNYGDGRIVRCHLAGGEPEPVNIDIKASLIAEYKDKILITSYTYSEDTEKYSIYVHTYDTESQELEEIVVSALPIGTSTAGSLRVYDGLLVASAFRQAFAVELPY